MSKTRQQRRALERVAARVPWTPFEEAHFKSEDIEAIRLAAPGRPMPVVFLNSRYQVLKYPPNQPSPDWPATIWLSIKRRDKMPVRSWRDLQRIKNELVGPENEAIEVFPAESRLVDEANQYHLYVLVDTMIRFPVGSHAGRFVGTPDEAASTGARQEPFES